MVAPTQLDNCRQYTLNRLSGAQNGQRNQKVPCTLLVPLYETTVSTSGLKLSGNAVSPNIVWISTIRPWHIWEGQGLGQQSFSKTSSVYTLLQDHAMKIKSSRSDCNTIMSSIIKFNSNHYSMLHSWLHFSSPIPGWTSLQYSQLLAKTNSNASHMGSSRGRN